METTSTKIEIFCFKDNDVRVTKMDGEPWFVAKDVCDALELGNARDAVSTLDEDEKITVGIADGNPRLGIPHSINLISLPGLFRLVSKSRVPMAKEFQRWVYHEVLPSIYYTGCYKLPRPEYEPVEVDYQTARLLMDSARVFRDVMSKPLRKQVMSRVMELSGMEFVDGGEGAVFSDDLMKQVECFIDECCEVDPRARCSRNDFYDCFSRWCVANGFDVPSRARAVRAMNRLARFACGRNGYSRFWEGVRCV